jgi:hypothetical protein
MRLAFHDPNKINEVVKSKGEIRDQAEALGLETEQWW